MLQQYKKRSSARTRDQHSSCTRPHEDEFPSTAQWIVVAASGGAQTGVRAACSDHIERSRKDDFDEHRAWTHGQASTHFPTFEEQSVHIRRVIDINLAQYQHHTLRKYQRKTAAGNNIKTLNNMKTHTNVPVLARHTKASRACPSTCTKLKFDDHITGRIGSRTLYTRYSVLMITCSVWDHLRWAE